MEAQRRSARARDPEWHKKRELTCDETFQKWTTEEKVRLVKMVQTYGDAWRAHAVKEMPYRSINAVARQWAKLKEDSGCLAVVESQGQLHSLDEDEMAAKVLQFLQDAGEGDGKLGSAGLSPKRTRHQSSRSLQRRRPELSSRETSEDGGNESDGDGSLSGESYRSGAGDGKENSCVDASNEGSEAEDEPDEEEEEEAEEEWPGGGKGSDLRASKSEKAEDCAGEKSPPAYTKRAKRERPSSDDGNRLCQFCGTTATPQWRRGPGGKDTLCNACGVRYRKSLGPNGFNEAPTSELLRPKAEPEDSPGEVGEDAQRALVWARRRRRAAGPEGLKGPETEGPTSSGHRCSPGSCGGVVPTYLAGHTTLAQQINHGHQYAEGALGTEAGSGSGGGLKPEEHLEGDRGMQRFWQLVPALGRPGRRVAESRNGDTEVSSDGHVSPAGPPSVSGTKGVAIPNPHEFELSPPTLRGTTEADREKCWQWLINMSSKVLEKSEWLDFVGRVNFAEQVPWPKIMWISLTTCYALVQLAPGCRVGSDDLQRLQAEIRKISSATTSAGRQ